MSDSEQIIQHPDWRPIVDVSQVTYKDKLRLHQWASRLIHKYESKLHSGIKFGETIASGEVKPEDIDVGAIYPFEKGLMWRIYRWHKDIPSCWCVMLSSNKGILCNFFFAKV